MSDWIPTLSRESVEELLPRRLAADPVDWSQCRLAQCFPRNGHAPEAVRREVYPEYVPGKGKVRRGR